MFGEGWCKYLLIEASIRSRYDWFCKRNIQDGLYIKNLGTQVEYHTKSMIQYNNVI